MAQIFTFVSNHSPRPKRVSFVELVKMAQSGDNPTFKALLQAQAQDIRQLTTNNEYVLRLSGITAYKQCKEISVSGFRLSKQYYSDLKLGKRLTCSMFVFAVLSNYWGLSVRDMLADGDEFRRIVADKLPNLAGLSGGESNE